MKRNRSGPGPGPIAIAMLALLGAVMVAGEANAAGFPWKTLSNRPDAWYRSNEAAHLAENVLSHQSGLGDWPKNLDTSATPFRGDRSKLRGTFDNGATIGEIRFLARMFVANSRDDYRDALLRGIDQILIAQYPNGGWPQSSPPGKKYPRYITFNDNTMVNLMELVRDVAQSDAFRFVDPARRAAADRAFNRGIDCILKCQIRDGGTHEPMVWCAQHDEKTFEPRGARTYELPSLSGSESAGILLLLMSLENPSPDVVRAVRGGVHWFEHARIKGIRQVVVAGDKKLVDDPTATPLWARFHEIGTNRPFFCGRDGVKKAALSEIEAERRNGYAWYGNWGRRVLERYPRWEQEKRLEKPATPSPGSPDGDGVPGRVNGRSGR